MLFGYDLSIAIGFLLMIGFIVLVHEFGHFISAKLLNIKVEEFSIGFGPKIIGIKRGETLYKIAPVPLGGYVKIYGMEEGEITEPDRAFYNRPRKQRLFVLAMGAIFNILSAYILLCAVYMIGVMERTYLDKPPVIAWVNDKSPAQETGFKIDDRIVAINDKKMTTWKDVQNTVLISPEQFLNITIERGQEELKISVKTGKISSHEVGYLGAMPVPPFTVLEVTPDSPAQKAGIKAGDIIYAVNDETMDDLGSVIMAISKNPDRAIKLSIERNKEQINIMVTPKKEDKRGIIGARYDPFMEKKSYGIGSFKRAAVEVGNNVVLIFVVIKKLVTGNMSLRTLSGPLDLARVSGSAYRSGAIIFMLILALISINLGVINLLPIPMLDGGHIVIMGIEWVRGKEFSIKLKERIAMVGLVLLLLLMAVVLYFDILKWIN
ncbi:MAG: RIP metalloprotease RseP [Candidatus Fischerbacteria bacterium RBG_13_37_8]|uniref:Zinc metalloprotease n=1 Tax=Candidatus Fischerbacteria bacterium RBG_13_37_8 TaxID=1817863 RepID=A0A1F5VTH9_9BACT|nr:MAG: RIP metalloprotease RseP [Candidatus Fischerbacteria bacterium RBG_13_37_8]